MSYTKAQTKEYENYKEEFRKGIGMMPEGKARREAERRFAMQYRESPFEYTAGYGYFSNSVSEQKE